MPYYVLKLVQILALFCFASGNTFHCEFQIQISLQLSTNQQQQLSDTEIIQKHEMNFKKLVC